MKFRQIARFFNVFSLEQVLRFLSVGMLLYHLIYSRLMFQGPIQHQTTHLLIALMIVYLGALKKKRWPWILPLILGSLVATGYILIYSQELEQRIGLQTTEDIYIGILLLIVTFLAALQALGKTLPIVGAVFIAYTLLGQYLPEPFWHFPVPLMGVISNYNIGFRGMFAMPLAASANYMILFMMFGAMLQASGASRFFIEIGRMISSRLAGGAGLTAVISSALVGTLTGSGAANVAVTGPFTIPMMKDVGYTAEQAAGIETVASAGGNIMPPIMGVLAFIMAEYMGIPYIKVAIMAIIPAILYYLCLGLFVQLNALKMRVKRMDTKVDFRVIRLTAPIFLIPFIAIVVLLVQGFSLPFVGFTSCVLVFLLSLIRKETRGNWGTWTDGAVNGARIGSAIAVTTSIVGVIMTSVNMTGLGLRFPPVVEALSGGSLPMALLLIAVMMVILGMAGISLTAYLLGAMLVIPALMDLGLALIPAHFFLMYFAVFAMITPPVALTAVIAAPIAGATYMKTAFQAVRAGAIAWAIPFMIVWSPGIILQPQEPIAMVTKLFSALIMVIFLQVGLVGYYLSNLNLGKRLISVTSAVLCLAFIINGNYLLFALGLAAGTILTLWQWRKKSTLN